MAKRDFKKEEKELYQPSDVPSIVEVPAYPFIMVDGEGDPNEPEGEFTKATELLYALSYAIKMSHKGEHVPEGFYDYVVMPLEGLWTMKGREGMDYAHKELLQFTAMIRQPEFVTPEVFEWARAEVERKKKLDTSRARLESFAEGLVVQCLHIGSYDDEPLTKEKMVAVVMQKGYILDYTHLRRHHEIYLSDPRKTEPDKLKTILRFPVRKGKS